MGIYFKTYGFHIDNEDRGSIIRYGWHDANNGPPAYVENGLNVYDQDYLELNNRGGSDANGGDDKIILSEGRGIVCSTNGIERLRIRTNGYVGIGTPFPTSGDGTYSNYLLGVNGLIKAKEIRVSVNNWADFVFDRDHVLPTLEDLEVSIQSTGHLPGIPSAENVIADGVDLGAMQGKLLQKIEELTLYVIQLNRLNAELTKRLGQLEDRK
jgi:hypothetical protein